MNVSEIPKEKLSPMMRQYVETKEKYSDCILFYRLGDFYEMFFEDAILVSRELELTLTGRDCGLPERAPMCGVPYHSVELHLKKLVDRGYKIAICEQLTDPSESRGLVERDVIRIVTPGTLIESSMLEDDSNNYIMRQTVPAPCVLQISPPEKCLFLSHRIVSIRAYRSLICFPGMRLLK